jgi:transposase
MCEGNTFREAIEKIKRRYRIKRAVIVADSWLLSKPNIEYLEKEKYEFILGTRLRKLSKMCRERPLRQGKVEAKT